MHGGWRFARLPAWAHSSWPLECNQRHASFPMPSAISNIISANMVPALSSAGLATQPNPIGGVGFASTLAAAQRFANGSSSTASQTMLASAEAEDRSTNGSAAENNSATSNWNGRTGASGNSQPKKPANNSTGMSASLASSGNAILPRIVPVANQAPFAASRSNPLPAVIAPQPQPGGVPMVTPNAQSGISSFADGSVPLPSPLSTAFNSLAENSAASAASSVPPNLVPANLGAHPPIPSGEPAPASTAQPAALAATAGQAGVENNATNDSTNNNSLNGDSLNNDSPSGAANAPPVLLASAAPAPQPATPLAADNNQTYVADSAAGVDFAAATDPAGEIPEGNPLAAVVNGAAPNAPPFNLPALNSPGELIAGKALRFAGSSPSLRTADQDRGASGSTSILGSAAASSSSAVSINDNGSNGNGSPLGSQTPFSVFFSSTGPGTESAAAVLPRMILPASNAALRDNLTSSTGASSASAQTSGLQNGAFSNTSAGSPAQNTVPTNGKDSAAANSSGSLPAAQSLHADGNAASAPAVTAQTSAPVAATPIATVTAPVPGQTASTNPPANPAPTAGAGNTTNMVPAAPQAMVVAAPGPVQVAQMVSRIGQSEMRIGMNTSAFGSVEVRTTIHASDVGLVIGSEKGDLRSVLASDLPAIANTLQQQNLRLNSVNFMQGFAFSNNSPGGGGSGQQGFAPAHAPVNSAGAEAPAEDSVEAATMFGSGGLSILA
jgi:hypothetical protein